MRTPTCSPSTRARSGDTDKVADPRIAADALAPDVPMAAGTDVNEATSTTAANTRTPRSRWRGPRRAPRRKAPADN